MKNQLLNKLSINNIKKDSCILKHYGPKDFINRLSERLQPEEIPYDPWYQTHRPSVAELNVQRARVWKIKPCFSIIVPAYQTPDTFLHQMIFSVQSQTYSN